MSRFRWKQLLLIIPMIIVVQLLTNRQIEQQPAPKQQSPEGQEIDYYMRQVHITHMGSDGAINEEIISEQLNHYPHDDHSDLTLPRFKILRADGEDLWAESKEGAIYGEQRIVLRQDAHVTQRSADTGATSHIEGNEITIERVSGKISSRETITVTGENYTIVAGAMELLSDEKRLYLSRGVEGHYEP